MRVIVMYTRPDGVRREWHFIPGRKPTTFAVDPPVTECPDPQATALEKAAAFRARGFTEVAVFDEDGALTIPTTKETP